MQHLLHRAKWDADAVRDDIRAHVVEYLHDEEAELVVDETGDLKKGTATVGVQSQYTGTAGRIENAQVAVYLVYSAARGHAEIDRANAGRFTRGPSVQQGLVAPRSPPGPAGAGPPPDPASIPHRLWWQRLRLRRCRDRPGALHTSRPTGARTPRQIHC